MPHTQTKHSGKDISEAIERLDAWAETLTAEDFEATDDLVSVARAADAVEAAKAALDAAVANARARDRSWNQIAISLGVSRQAARQRFGDSTRVEALAHAEKVRRASVAGARSAKTKAAATGRYKKVGDAEGRAERSKRATRRATRAKST
jgi:hypothetical protein